MPSATTSSYLHQKQMDYLLKNTAWTAPATLYVALYTTVPALDGTGGTEVSTSGTNYARVTIAAGAWTGPTGANLEYSNTNDLVFGVPSANWGTITGCGLYDASTSGNLYCVASLSTSKVVSNGDGAPKILAGQLRLSRAVCP
jgi:hypothetical protein